MIFNPQQIFSLRATARPHNCDDIITARPKIQNNRSGLGRRRPGRATVMTSSPRDQKSKTTEVARPRATARPRNCDDIINSYSRTVNGRPLAGLQLSSFRPTTRPCGS
jgi:hypothetical protein